MNIKRSLGVGLAEKGDYASFKATLTFIKHDANDPWYTACPTDGCNKKVTEINVSGDTDSWGILICELVVF